MVRSSHVVARTMPNAPLANTVIDGPQVSQMGAMAPKMKASALLIKSKARSPLASYLLFINHKNRKVVKA